ncbi:hypothetical protein [Inquilinus sp.]|jgi:hypothetical protein|uniref:hypothetical protein n=1 Tax=Inquilinus sp. TaxID=1932117 RepID=UPI0037839231
MSLFGGPLFADPPPDGRHPDVHYRASSLLPGQNIRVPGLFLISAPLAFACGILAGILALRMAQAGRSGPILIIPLLLALLSGLLLFATVAMLWKGVRWRAARRRFAAENGTLDLGYFRAWDGRHGEALARERAEVIVRANITLDRDG